MFTDFELTVLERALSLFKSELDHQEDFPFSTVGELRQGIAAALGGQRDENNQPVRRAGIGEVNDGCGPVPPDEAARQVC